MKQFYLKCKRAFLAGVSFVLMVGAGLVEAKADAPCDGLSRRNGPCSLVHIDTWNYPDPERIIEMVPEDILPYVVFNISLSASDNVLCGRLCRWPVLG